MTDSQELYALADQYLPPGMAEHWKRLLRPAIQFDWAAGDDRVAAQLGGDPELPLGEAWPEWEGHGPLAFVASFDCAETAIDDLPLPKDGRLLFFYFDGQVDGGEEVVGAFEPGTQGGARVLYVPEGAAVESRPAPAPLKAFPRQLLRANPVWTAPEPDSARIAASFGGRGDRGPGHPVDAMDFQEAVDDEVSVSTCHQLGGFAHSVQGPVEFEAVDAVDEVPGRSGDPDYGDPDQWLLLAQIDSDDGSSMMWGDMGTLYWLIQEPDLAALRFDRAVFTWQCG